MSVSLAKRLHGYPPVAVTRAAPAALDVYLASRDARLQALTGLLEAFQIDVHRALAGEDSEISLDDIDGWVSEHWSGISATRKQLTRTYWRQSECRGGDIAYAMLHDTALLLGEMVIRRRPGTQWGFDPDADPAQAGALPCRPMLLGLANPATGLPTAIDFHLQCFTAFDYVQKAAEPAMHCLTQYCRAAIERYPLVGAPPIGD